MPAKKRNEPKYKPFIGRMFTIRKHKVIPGYPVTPNVDRTDFLNEEFSSVVLVLDETNTQVRVTIKDNRTIWVSKFFLLKEIKNEHFRKVDSLAETVSGLATVTSDIRNVIKNENSIKTKKELKEILANLEIIIGDIRAEADKHNPTFE